MLLHPENSHSRLGHSHIFGAGSPHFIGGTSSDSEFILATPHYNLVLYDPSIGECVEVVLDSTHRNNTLLLIYS